MEINAYSHAPFHRQLWRQLVEENCKDISISKQSKLKDVSQCPFP